MAILTIEQPGHGDQEKSQQWGGGKCTVIRTIGEATISFYGTNGTLIAAVDDKGKKLDDTKLTGNPGDLSAIGLTGVGRVKVTNGSATRFVCTIS